MMPFTTVQKKIKGIDWLDDIMCSAVAPAAIKPAEKQITALLRERHHLRPDEENDFNLRHPAEIAEAGAESQRIMTILLASIASVSLDRGRDRYYEHHARIRHRAHARDRRASGSRRNRIRCSDAVSWRSHGLESAGWSRLAYCSVSSRPDLLRPRFSGRPEYHCRLFS